MTKVSRKMDCLDGVSEKVLKVFTDGLKFTSCTPVQQAAIPLFLSNADVAVEAPTGSGKTLSYLIPMFEMVLRNPMEDNKQKPGRWRGIVISPTRELSKQIHLVAEKFEDATDVKVGLFTGGTSVDQDVKKIETEVLDVVIATPGRLEHLMKKLPGFLSWKHFEVLIMDEADILLNMGFEKTITSILSVLPKQRRTGLFSATQTNEVKALIRAGLRNPSVIAVQVEQADGNKQKTPTSLDNFYLVCKQEEKLRLLCEFINQHRDAKMLVFFSTCASVGFFEKMLPLVMNNKKKRPNINFFGLHGQMKQSSRNRVYKSFLEGEKGVLLCTDVAARGLDIPTLDWVVCFDPPDAEMFVHRVGRTARAGRKGCALMFLLEKETTFVHLLEGRKVPVLEFPDTKQLYDGNEFVDVLAKAKKEVFQDRDLLEKGTKAFIAHLRSYREHKCPYIFRLKNLNLTKVAESFVLLQLPKISEFRETQGLKDFVPEPHERVAAIPFKDKHREKQRQENFAKKKEQMKKEKFDKMKTKLKKAKEAEEAAKTPKRRKKKSKHKEILEEWDQLAEEERMYKKLKKRKITQEQYDQVLMNVGTKDDNDEV